MSEYRIVIHTCPILRTHWWKDLDNPRSVETSYWLEGPGVNRPATDIELAVYRDTIERAVRAVKPFSAYVNVSSIGNTPEQALREEFG